ncbi:phospholipase [bacterium SCSIO 12741]|nr:phospholipase [bacterium SCSIO 12741]
MEKHYLPVTRTSRQYLMGNQEDPEVLWLVLHGFGQQARYFTPKVKVLDNGRSLVVVAEGLNRFYLEGYNGRVGATWMTSDDREKDIEDNNNYLEDLVCAVTDQFTSRHCRIKVLAFSQGIATACRWMAATHYHVEEAVLWAGSLPPDLDWEATAHRWKKMKLHYVFGNQDEFFNREKIAGNEQLLKDQDIPYEFHLFDGKHEMNDEVLLGILNQD